jgi:hypothetical protein
VSDYDEFMRLMTEKLKATLAHEIKKKKYREANSVLKESFSEVRDFHKNLLSGEI